MANPTTNYGFVLPTSTDLVTDLPADFDVALQGVDTRLKALNPSTTLGDTDYASATANTNTRLGIGSTGQVLTVAGGVPVWATPAVGGGKVLQVVNATYSTQTINSTTSYADTGLTATITPTLNTSKILCLVSQAGVYKQQGADNFCHVQLLRSGSSIIEFEKQGGRTETTATNAVAAASTSYLDSPATTSATTYKTQFKSELAAGASVRVQAGSGFSTITLLEIGA